MGCLEKSPDWRPKDLTYLAQLAAAQQKVGRAPSEPPPTVSTPARGVPAPREAAARPAAAPRRESRSQMPLVLAATLLVGAAGASYYSGWVVEPPPPPTARRHAYADRNGRAGPQRHAHAGSGRHALGYAAARRNRRRRDADSAGGPRGRDTAAARLGARDHAAERERRRGFDAPSGCRSPGGGSEPAAPAVEPSSLSTVSPLSMKRGGRVLLDIRGAGLRADQHVQILPIKDVPRGISVVRQKWANANLVTVLLELDANVTPTAYAITLESANGERTNPLHITVTK